MARNRPGVGRIEPRNGRHQGTSVSGESARTAVAAAAADADSRAATQPVIRTAGLRKVFRSGHAELTVLAGIDLTVEQGEMVAIVGASGAGKSTLLDLLAAVDTATSGTGTFGG